MNKNLLFLVLTLVSISTLAQVTQINSNKSLGFQYPLTSSKAIYVAKDSTIWVTDGTLAGTVQISTTIKFVESMGSTAFLNGTLLFEGTTAATGGELYITDGTIAGTKLVSDINPGAASSNPSGDEAVLNGFIYFFASRPAEGRELWRTDGTPGGTSFVKDIVPGATGSTTPGKADMFSSGSYLLFAATNAASGTELWTSDGTASGTVLLKEINAGAASSNPNAFYPFNGLVLFTATEASTGTEIWKTDGTPGGTTILKDINPGAASSIGGLLGTGIGYFLIFNNKAFFTANDGSADAIWGTDGTTVGTTLIKDPGVGTFGSILIFDAAILSNKFIFPVASIFPARYELWESDGTPGGTKLFKSFDGDQSPVIFIPIDISAGTVTPSQRLFQGNKFFFAAKTLADGNELWISDGTLANTNMVKNINPGAADGIDQSYLSYTYTSTTLFFPANNGTNGVELWKSDGTPGGTSMVADIITGATTSEPSLNFLTINNKVLFNATNGDDPNEFDLYAVDGTFTPLPVKLTDFTVTKVSADALLNWHTAQEINTKNFTVQRSFDALNFENIGSVSVNGSGTNSNTYTFRDAGVVNTGKAVVYYRLLSNDVDGKTQASAVIKLRLSGNNNWSVKVISNPASSGINVALFDIKEPVQLSIIDMNGKRLISNKYPAANGQLLIPAGSLAHGTYILLAETAGERSVVQFVK